MHESLVNLAHLDHLSEDVACGKHTARIVHIYAEAPDYRILADPEEGTSCIDDVARAAVVYLRDVELTGDPESRRKAERCLRFVLYMQTPEGLFYNFVVNNRLEINREHFRSRADRFTWWAARGVWALSMGAHVLAEADPAMATECAQAVRRSLPRIEELLDKYPHTIEHRGRRVPTWLIGDDAADATSDLLLGLAAYQRVAPSAELATMIARFAEGIGMMRYGSMNQFPYGMHASHRDGWHLWGNTQTQALAEAGMLASAKLEAEHFFSRLLVEGYLHSIQFDDLHGIRYFERIAYGVRGVVVGLIRLFEATGDERFVRMAGLAASWFMGNNLAGAPMYDPATGRGYDGLDADGSRNENAGAESTLESLLAMLELQRHPQAMHWLDARSGDPTRMQHDGTDYFYRIFEKPGGASPRRMGLFMNLTCETFELREDGVLDAFLAG